MNPINASAKTATLQLIEYTAPTGFISSLTQSTEIPITNCEQLLNIGSSSIYPENAKYTIKNDIDCNSIRTRNFQFATIKNGELDGKGHSISHLKNTLFKKVEDSNIHNMTIKDATVYGKNSLLSESISGDSRIDDVNFENVKMFNSKATNAAGILCPSISGNTKVKNIDIEKSMLVVEKNQANAPLNIGLLTGSAEGNSQIYDIKINGSNLSVRPLGNSGNNVGGCVGLMSENSHTHNIFINNTRITANDNQTAIGGAVGRSKDNSLVHSTLVHKSYIASHGAESSSGGVLGVADSLVLQGTSYGNSVESHAPSSNSGGVIGKSNSNAHSVQLLSIKNDVTATAANSNAGGIIAVNEGDIKAGFSVYNTAMNKSKQMNNPISVNDGTSEHVSNEANCFRASFASKLIDKQCRLKTNDEAPTTVAPSATPSMDVISAGRGAVFFADVAVVGVAAAATVGGVCYLIREYVRANKTDTTNKVKLFFKPITSIFNQFAAYNELEEAAHNENDGVILTTV